MMILAPWTPKKNSLRNHNHAPYAYDGYASFPNYASSPDSLIDSKLKRKIDPKSMLPKNQKKDVDTADNNDSHDAVYTSPHTPNDATAPDTKNMTYFRQLLDG